MWHVLCTTLTSNFSEEFLPPIILVGPIHLYHHHHLYSKFWWYQIHGTEGMTTAYHAGSRCAKRDWNAFFASWLSGTANWQNLKTNILISEQILYSQNFQLRKEHFNLFDTAAVRFISGHHLALIFHLRKISCWQLLDYDRLSDLEISRSLIWIDYRIYS